MVNAISMGQTQAWIREPYQGINLAWPPPHLIFSFRLQGEEERMQHQDVPFPSAAVRSSFSHCLSLRRANSFHPAADALAPRKRLRGRLEREEGLNRMRRDVTDWKRSEKRGSPKRVSMFEVTFLKAITNDNGQTLVRKV